MVYDKYFSRTPDGDFRWVYPCEIILSHIPVPAPGKDKKWTVACWPHFVLWRHCNVKMTSPCHNLSVFRIFWKSFSCFLQYKMRCLVVSKKKNPLFVWGWDRKIRPSQSPIGITQTSLVMPISAPRDGFFYLTLTLMIDSYISNNWCFNPCPAIWLGSEQQLVLLNWLGNICECAMILIYTVLRARVKLCIHHAVKNDKVNFLHYEFD